MQKVEYRTEKNRFESTVLNQFCGRHNLKFPETEETLNDKHNNICQRSAITIKIGSNNKFVKTHNTSYRKQQLD